MVVALGTRRFWRSRLLSRFLAIALTQSAFAFLGVSIRDDVAERRNRSAGFAVAGNYHQNGLRTSGRCGIERWRFSGCIVLRLEDSERGRTVRVAGQKKSARGDEGGFRPRR